MNRHCTTQTYHVTTSKPRPQLFVSRSQNHQSRAKQRDMLACAMILKQKRGSKVSKQGHNKTILCNMITNIPVDTYTIYQWIFINLAVNISE